MPWKLFQFKDQAVYVRVLPDGKPIVHRGRVELRYRLGATKSYRAAPANLVESDGPVIPDVEMSGSPTATTSSHVVVREMPDEPATPDTIVIHTDGACSGNPGPAGIGILIERQDEIVEISEFIGSGTNNIAELTAIFRALESLREDERDAHIHLYTDSGWSIGVLLQSWKAKTNLELITKIKEIMTLFPRLEVLKVRGHAGQAGNVEADELATMAVRRESSMNRSRKRSSLPRPVP